MRVGDRREAITVTSLANKLSQRHCRHRHECMHLVYSEAAGPITSEDDSAPIRLREVPIGACGAMRCTQASTSCWCLLHWFDGLHAYNVRHMMSHPDTQPRSARSSLSIPALVLLALCAVATVGAQGGVAPERGAKAVKAGGNGVERAIWLLVQPDDGDVLHLELQQIIEMTGARRDAYPLPGALGQDARSQLPPGVGPRRNTTPTRVTMMDFYAHSTVERRDANGTVVLASTDSLSVRSGEVGQTLTSQRVALDPKAPPSRIRVLPNGAMVMSDAVDGGAGVGATLSAMPAMLPDGPVRIGDSWERDVPMPSLPIGAYRSDGVLRAIFRLDSTTRDGRDAHVSVRGTLQRDGSTRDLPPGSRVVTAGTMKGTLRLDRVRGWIVDARTTIEVQSEVVSVSDDGPPMQIGIRITQRLRVR